MTEVPLLKLFCGILKKIIAHTWSTLILWGSYVNSVQCISVVLHRLYTANELADQFISF